MRTNGVHCRESTGTRRRPLVVLKSVPVRGAAFSGFPMGQFFMRLPFPRTHYGYVSRGKETRHGEYTELHGQFRKRRFTINSDLKQARAR